jgi:hypothetical protein
MVDIDDISRNDIVQFEDSTAIDEGIGTVLRTCENEYAVDVNPDDSKHEDIVVYVDDITWHQSV